MKELLLAAAFSLAAGAAFAIELEPPVVEPHGSWKLFDGVFKLTTKEDKSDFSELAINLKIEAHKSYVLSWTAKSSASRTGEQMLLVPKWKDERQCAGGVCFLGSEKSRCISYFNSGETSGDAVFKLLAPSPFARSLEAGDFSLQERMDSPGVELLPDGGGLFASNVYPTLLTPHGWKLGEPYPLRIVIDGTSVLGVSAEFKLSKSSHSIASISLPVSSKARYRFECWAKASEDLPLKVSFNNWFNPHRDNPDRPDKGIWCKSFCERAGSEWRKRSFVFETPEDFSPYPDFQAGVIRVFIGSDKDDATIWISGASFKRLP